MDTPFVHIYIDLPRFQTLVICQDVSDKENTKHTKQAKSTKGIFFNTETHRSRDTETKN